MRSRGIAIVAVLALLTVVSLLFLSYTTLTAVNWLSARNLREGLHAWSRVEAAVAVVTGQLETGYRRDGALPETYRLSVEGELESVVAYRRETEARADVEIVARFGKAAVRRSLVLDLGR